VRAANIEGFIEIKRGRFRMRRWERGALRIDLYDVANFASTPDDLSELCIRHWGRKVFEIHWNEVGAFRVARFDEMDEWMAQLRKCG